jgi:predicted phosphoadenosine phosphosulfate sulfurtransferase
VFNNGTPKGLTKCKPIGDQTSPKSWTGTNAASKKVQKIPKKNINSLKTNKTTPNLKPSITKKLWKPTKPSKEISFAQKKETINKTIKQKKKKK